MDWIGVALNLTGMYLLPKKKYHAMAIFLVGNLIWITWAASHGIWSILILQFCFVSLNIRTIRLWQKEKIAS